MIFYVNLFYLYASIINLLPRVMLERSEAYYGGIGQNYKLLSAVFAAKLHFNRAPFRAHG